MTTFICCNCKQTAVTPLAVDDIGRVLCAACCAPPPPAFSPETLGLAYLRATIPYKRGDRVHASTAAEVYDGVGTVREVSEELRHGGSPVYPAFLVEIDEPANPDAPKKGWYTEPCLVPADQPAPADKCDPGPEAPEQVETVGRAGSDRAV